MKVLKLIQLATVANVSHAKAQISAAAKALAAGCDLDGAKPNAYLRGCVSDDYCHGLDGHRIFNHFHLTSDSVRGQRLTLVPECRQINADITAGFTCGTDTRLATGGEVVIPNVPVTGVDSDTRTIKLLKTEKYKSLSTALKTHNDTIINHFSDGCSSPFPPENGFTRFTNFFSIKDCEPEQIKQDNNGLIIGFKIFIGYDDLTVTVPVVQKVTVVDLHKVSHMI